MSTRKKTKTHRDSDKARALVALCVACVTLVIVGFWMLSLGSAFNRIDAQMSNASEDATFWKTMAQEFKSLTSLGREVKGVKIEGTATESELLHMEQKVFGQPISQ
ncbi:MAG: hypothetical protein A3H59_03750 [Candidatus Jacksonbacteria bacterium RIFCSPLOWO2_02_FULL_43_9]|nr:MAG: hypothetical protein UV70_C0025G0009 [Parcubacteria group bacterium GW2011_GWA2_43_13]OGY71302.1 MAG: hypothetical protein A2986_04635 [Candidatus Jacksonbacteria bacterium RIFCSPLOWO2_01_FULL_44_13]OGY72646.1 MAG: hypothetical protein A3H59_03750 [Candidatus Jacksonbacteria bacterium RIFCSPLOWO2_02_FULL_43_9]HAZ16708.1 hypothetical protein [Candidatus Jacksonbacteria bacterium]